MPSRILTTRNLLYNVFAYKSYKFYDFLSIWKIIIHIWRKFNFITDILTKKEKKCTYNEFNYKLPNSLAYLASKELIKIKIYRTHRTSISEYYDELINNKYIKPLFKVDLNEKNNYFRYPIIMNNEKIKNKLYNYMKNHNILLWNTWSNTNIVPHPVKLDDANYTLWTCKKAEIISKRLLTLPNHRLIKFKDAKRIIELLNKFENNGQ
jgi:dTDP-4-amino-4,6-dideoxygalactose transaminase